MRVDCTIALMDWMIKLCLKQSRRGTQQVKVIQRIKNSQKKSLLFKILLKPLYIEEEICIQIFSREKESHRQRDKVSEKKERQRYNREREREKKRNIERGIKKE